MNLAKKFPEWHCRRIAYTLEKKAVAFIGKTKVAEIMKAHGLNHPFERQSAKPAIPPADMLLHEPWRKNLTWGMDWTWVNVNDRFMFLLVLLDCTSSNRPVRRWWPCIPLEYSAGRRRADLRRGFENTLAG